MSWFHNRYKSRPASKHKAARIAWDVMSRMAERMAPPRNLVVVWFDDSQDDGYWCAELDGVDADGLHDYLELDGLVVRDHKNNPHKYKDSKTFMLNSDWQ